MVKSDFDDQGGGGVRLNMIFDDKGGRVVHTHLKRMILKQFCSTDHDQQP